MSARSINREIALSRMGHDEWLESTATSMARAARDQADHFATDPSVFVGGREEAAQSSLETNVSLAEWRHDRRHTPQPPRASGAQRRKRHKAQI